jgi:hypothetical protein
VSSQNAGVNGFPPVSKHPGGTATSFALVGKKAASERGIFFSIADGSVRFIR